MIDWQDRPTGAQVMIGKTRKDGKVPVKIIFTGKTCNMLAKDYDAATAMKLKYQR